LSPTELTALAAALATQSAWARLLCAIGSIAALLAFGLYVRLSRRLVHQQAQEADRLRSLAEAVVEGIVIIDGGVVADANLRFCDLVGSSRDQIVGRRIAEFLPDLDHLGVLAAIESDGQANVDLPLQPTTGEAIEVEAILRPLDRGRPSALVAAIRDISERVAVEARIRHLAHHDPLTDLPNRALFAERCREALLRAGRYDEQIAILCLDLDRFKEVNDTHGHATGDQLLQAVAALLTETCRGSDTVARLGGDEFAILQLGGRQPDDAARLAERLVDRLTGMHQLGNAAVDVGTSIGIAVFPGDGDDVDSVLSKADMALYRAKSEGRGTFRVYEAGMDAKLQARRTMERQLAHAINHNGLCLHYQPQANANSGAIVGFEALVRWPHPERGLLPPAAFITLAEESGLIRPLGEWVLREACRQAITWPRHLRIGVNISPGQLARDDLTKLVRQVLAESGLEPRRLELEITETALVGDTDSVLAILQELKAIGVQITMDDFGTGYSSLSYLQRFRFDRIKVDRSFMASLRQRPETATIIGAIVGLSRSLDLPVIAEGVEDAAELEVLRGECCDEVQGYLIGRPMASDAVVRFIARAMTVEHRATADVV